MKLHDVWLASQLVGARERLLHLRDGCKLGGHLRSPSGGTHETLDPPMVKLMEPVVRAELDRRLALIDADLVAIGVIVNEDTATER